MQLTNPFFDDTNKLLGADPRWDILPTCFRTIAYSSLVLAMLCVQACGVEQLVASVHAAYPLRLFLFIRGSARVAAMIHGECKHLLDEFKNSAMILSEFTGSNT